MNERSASVPGDRPHMDRHVDPTSESSVWRVDDVLDDTTSGDWIAQALPRFEYTVGSLMLARIGIDPDPPANRSAFRF